MHHQRNDPLKTFDLEDINISNLNTISYLYWRTKILFDCNLKIECSWSTSQTKKCFKINFSIWSEFFHKLSHSFFMGKCIYCIKLQIQEIEKLAFSCVCGKYLHRLLLTSHFLIRIYLKCSHLQYLEMLKVRRKSICRPTNCGFSNCHRDNLGAIFSSVSSPLLTQLQCRDPSWGLWSFQPPNFSTTISERKIKWTETIKVGTHFLCTDLLFWVTWKKRVNPTHW